LKGGIKLKLYANIIKKKLIVSIIITVLFLSAFPAINGVKIKSENDNKCENGINIENPTITFYSIEKNNINKCNAKLSSYNAGKLIDLIHDLKNKIVNEPYAKETKCLKSEFIDFIYNHHLLPKGLTKDDVISLLNPPWVRLFENTQGLKTKSKIFTSFENTLNHMGKIQQFFLNSEILEIPEKYHTPASVPASLLFCSMASFGKGIPIPLFIIPRPRVFLLWAGSEDSGTNVGGLISQNGFLASGTQIGVALGFLGVGITYSALGFTFYVFIGYSMFVFVSANEVEWYGPG
jgi:hypothetical protein